MSTYAELLADPDLLFYLPLNDTGVTTDVVNVQGAAATLTGGDTCNTLASTPPPWGTGSLDFDGTADYVALDQTYTCEDNWTFCCWMRPDELGIVRQPLIGNGSTQFIECYANDIIVRFAGPVANSGNITGRVSTDQWAHVAVVRNSDDSTTFYINGRFFSTDSVNLLTNNATFSQIGQLATNYFNGNLAEAMLFDRALTADEVFALFSKGVDKFDFQLPTAALADYSLPLDLSQCSDAWWNRVGASDNVLWAYKQDHTRLPVDLISIDRATKTGEARVLWSGTLPTTGTIELLLPPASQYLAAPAASDTYGSDNAYDEYFEGYWTNGSLSDRTANGMDLTAFGNAATLANGGLFGDGFTLDGSGDYYRHTATTPVTAPPFTMMGWANVDSTAVNDDCTVACLGTDDSAIPVYRWSLYRDTSGGTWNSRLLAFDDASTYSDADMPSALTEEYHHFAAVVASSTSRTPYFDGVAGTEGTASNTPTGIDTFLVGRGNGDFAGELDEVQLHSIDRSTEWIAYEYDATSDPATFWGTPTYTEDAGGGNEALTVSPAVINLSGQSVGMTVGRVLVVSPAVVNVSGQLVDMTYSPLATYDDLVVSPAVVNVTGQSVGLTVDRVLTVSPAVVNVSGQSVDMTYTPDTSNEALTVSPAVVNVTGQSVGMTVGRRLVVDAATVNVSGQAIELKAARTLTVSPATVNITGQSVGLTLARQITIAPATVNVSGQQVVLTYSEEELPTITIPYIHQVARPVTVHSVVRPTTVLEVTGE